ncbi:hypothetical protein CFK41_11995 [Brachybacterium ginsengisoli]|uniref:Uncharacterized protein n=1 Tax=Brachybacterium ginsengisoli TaxID=1331682 RepID=A0A291GYW3_9MICO|nr:hypothetical protein [Brachybacterium ginsengisoli]ATG55409.1 hypothetical protein CFK41_11995 [Brachybacterium ginsengisoli]
MVSRRGALGSLTGAVTLVLSGCLVGGKDVSDEAAEAAAAVEGVESAELERFVNNSFSTALRGTVELGTTEREVGVHVFDDAMRAIISVIADELDGDAASGLKVGGIVARLGDGQQLDVLELDPDMPTENPRADRVSAGAFFEKYGIG